MSIPASPATPDRPAAHEAPPANMGLLVVAGVLLAIPVVALMLVNTYAKKEPTLGGFPFFIWYQFLWVFLCSGFTYAAYRIVLVARPHVPMTDDGTAYLDRPSPTPQPGKEGDR